MQITDIQRQLLHNLMLGDEPDGDCWMNFDPPFDVRTFRACESKGLIEVSGQGMRLTNAGRAFLSAGR